MDFVYKGHMRFLICCNIVTHICELCVWQMIRSEDCLLHVEGEEEPWLDY